jgi:hypothetical protein
LKKPFYLSAPLIDPASFTEKHYNSISEHGLSCSAAVSTSALLGERFAIE